VTTSRRGWAGLFAIWVALATASAAAGSGEDQAMLALVVNHVERGDAVVVLRGGDVLIRVSDLEAAGLHAAAGTQETIDGERMVSLASLRGITFKIDRDDLALAIDAAPQLLPRTTVDLREGRPSDLTSAHDHSAWLNYAVTVADGVAITLVGETGVSLGGSLLQTSAMRTSGGPIVRSASSWTVDWPEWLVRNVLGDSFASAGGLGGGTFIGGLSISRSYALDPYFVQYPRLNLAGAAYTPSEVDVYVNGTLVRRTALPPGQFTLKNVPVVNGADSTRLVIRDAYGHEQSIDGSYYFATGVLAPGLSDFAFNLGAERTNVSTQSWGYGRPVVVARYRRGVTDWLTPGAHVETRDHLVSGGTSAAMRLPLAALELEAAASCDDAVPAGGAAGLTYSYAGPRASAGVSLHATSDAYATLSTPATADRATMQVQAFAGARAGPVGFSAQLSYASMRDSGIDDHAEVSASTVVRGVLVTASASYDFMAATDDNATLFLGVTLPLGARTSASAFATQQNRATSGQLALTRSLPSGPGAGFDVRATTGASSGVQAAGLYQTSFGRYEVHANESGGNYGYSATASGGIVAIGGRVIATRAVQDGFALVQVPGVAGVPVTLDRVEVGKTDRNGDLLIPSLLPYFGNRIAIDPSVIPLDHSVDATDVVLATPYRGGALVRFPVRELESARGTLVVELPGEHLVPRFGELTVAAPGRARTSPIGNAGEFYLDDLTSGTYPARIDYERGVCNFELRVPARRDAIVELGTVTCTSGVMP